MSVARVLGIVQAVSGGLAPLSLSALSRLLQIPKSSLLTLLTEMEQLGLVRRDEDGQYHQGGQASRLGLQLVSPHSLAALVRRALAGLGQQLGMTATFARLDSSTHALIYSDRWEIPDPVRFAVTLGQPLDLHCRSAGKLLLAHEPLASLPQWLGPEPYRAMTAGTKTRLRQLVPELQAIAAAGIAWSHGESFPGVGSCNVAVHGADQQVLAALGIEAPLGRLGETAAADVADVLRAAAQALSRDMRAFGITRLTLAQHL
ncbi:IclR family transcriptional regulator [Pseudorhodoferax sp. Leaf267]|uniref:IclR family transcriptional regulator n=1 Tax=Pseudorhodoferax sp. Leaf267 TaxID=1736316 RepID=UPI00138EE8E0|nr:IclR family transcriptional regulator C-terminal domain-containing protein [Pseudorhodoferax sp. Leaf267]